MKILIRVLLGVFVTITAVAQKPEDNRMNRDIEVTENVLTTMIKQQFSNQRMFFPLEVTGHYQEGYGVTFRIPADYTTPIVFTTMSDDNGSMPVGNNSNVFTRSGEITQSTDKNSIRLTDKTKAKQTQDMDSLRGAYDQRVIEAARMFILDYGDMLTQLPAGEKIIITNQGNQPRPWVNQFFNSSKRSLLSIEMVKSDVMLLKSGKITRDQALSKISILHTETVEPDDADLELLASMFNRLYRPDLSKTYFTENYVYYEKMKNFGVIFYIQMISSNEMGFQRYIMPTVGLENVDLETRNKKVTELYPQFEKELKENIVEYGRTLKSITDTELLVFQVRITKCPDCGIPSSLELAVKGSVLKDFSNGKITQQAAISKIVLKKGERQ
jgi:hypothetical protein